MKIIFGKEDCENCQKERNKFDALKIPYKYFDVETKEGLAEMAIRGLITNHAELPVIIEDQKHGLL